MLMRCSGSAIWEIMDCVALTTCLFRAVMASIIQPRTPLRSHTHNLTVRIRIRPDDVEAIIRISRRIFIPKRIGNIRQSIMFPADQNIARPVVALHSIRNAVRVVAVAVRVDCEAEVFREGLDGLVGAGAFAAWVGVLGLVDDFGRERVVQLCGETTRCTHFS
jgi:hypothetical protein